MTTHHPPSGGAEPSAASLGIFHALRFPSFRLLWAGNAFTSAAMWIQQTTMGWVVYDITGSGSILGGVNSVRGLPSLFAAPVAGVLADRFNRQRIIAVTQAAMFSFTFLLALGLFFNRIEVWHLFVFTLLMGLCNAFNMPVRQTLVFDVVPRNALPNAIALGNLAFSTARAIGPMIGGALIVLFGPANNFFLQSLLYLGVMASVLLIRVPPRSQTLRKPAFLRDMAEGYSYAAKSPQIRLLLLMMCINPLFLIPLHLALLPIFAKDVFQAGPSGLGILLASLGAGGVLGGLLTASLNRVDRRGLLQLAAVSLYAVSQAAFSLVALLTGNLWLSFGFLILAGASEAVYGATNQTVLQLVAPDHLRGRITAILQVQPLLMSIGFFYTGTAADFFSAPYVGMAISGIALALSLGILVFSPRMRALRLSRLGAEKQAAPART